MAESTLTNLLPRLGRNSLNFKGEPNGEGRLQPPNQNLEQTNLEDKVIFNFLHILGGVLSFKRCIFLIFVTHIWDSSILSKVYKEGYYRTLPSPAKWKSASVEKTSRCRAFCRQPICFWHTMACITASNPPSGESRFPETFASLTLIYKVKNRHPQFKEL